MKTIKAGTFPGEVKEYVVESNTTVADVLRMAGITLGAEMEVKADGNAIDMDATVENVNLLIVTKRLKGAI